jgi:type IV secretion system protein VirD4
MQAMLHKTKRVLTSRKVKSILILTGIYILDAWLIGSFAVLLKNIPLGMELYGNPLKAAITVPRAGVMPAWVILNIVVGFLLGITALFIYIRVPELAEKVSPKKARFIDDPTCGTARWMEPEEIPKTLELGHGPGILLGAYEGTPVRLHNKGRLNRNITVFGAPGTGKTWSVILPNCMQAVVNHESVVVTDPKSEIARLTIRFFQKHGYNVRVFNLIDMLHSDRWNPLSEVTNDIEAQMFTEIVIANTAVPGIKKMGGDPFWDRAEQNLLKALTLYVILEYPPEKRNIYSIYTLLASGDTDHLDLTFKSLDENHPAKAPYNIYSQASGTVKGGVIQGLGTRLQVFQNDYVRQLTETSDIDLEAPGREKCAYYCVVSDTDSTFDFLSSLFYSFLFIKLTRLGDKSGGKCPVNINFLLDEFCNIGAIPDFKKRIATMRSRGISCTIITQSLPQLKNRYPQDAWQEIISCCDSRLFLGVNDNETAKYLSESLDTGTVEQKSIARNTDSFVKARVTKGPKARPLMTMGETLKMDESKAVLIIRGRDPLMIDKLAYTEHPLASGLEIMDISDYRPSWKTEPLPEIEIEWGKMGETPEEAGETTKAPEEADISGPEADLYKTEDSNAEITEDNVLNRKGDNNAFWL